MNSCFGLCGNIILTKCNKLKLSYLNKKSNKASENYVQEDANNNNSSSAAVVLPASNSNNNELLYESIISVEQHTTINSSRTHLTRLPLGSHQVKSLDIIPRKNGILDGDWILKISNADLNSGYPWHTSKSYYNFDLTPWRRSRPSSVGQILDAPQVPKPTTTVAAAAASATEQQPLANVVMPLVVPQWNIEAENRILSKLHRNSRSLVKKKQNTSDTKKLRDKVRVRLIFAAIEVKDKEKNKNLEKVEVQSPNIPLRTFKKSNIILENIKKYSNTTQQKNEQKQKQPKITPPIPLHWGYFSQRCNPVAIKSLSINNTHTKTPGLVDNTKFRYSTNSLASIKSQYSVNDYKRITSEKKKLNSSKTIVTYCFIDNGKFSQFLCSTW